MKFCPKCNCDYLDEAVSCGDCKGVLFGHPDGAQGELSLKKMMALYNKEFPSPFYPMDGFYENWVNPVLGLEMMGKHLCNWLKLDSKKVKIEYDSSLSDIPGRFIFRYPISHIGIHPKYSNTPFKVAAILAHELMHFYMHEWQLGSPDSIVNEFQTDLAVLCSGFGILYINGMKNISRGISAEKLYHRRGEANRQEWVGYFKPELFCALFTVYLKEKGLSGSDVIGYIHPDARDFLPNNIKKSKSSKPTKIISILEKKHRRNTIIVNIVTILLLLYILFHYIH